ncbi:MAG: FAD-dependent oxidoreductase, partial [Bdellovibrionales bacterium]|nr:FAD-dependent oxidoreductase [Bdellovibrionales bacterium]
LEMFDFKQVFFFFLSREELFITAGHITKPIDFLIPLLNDQKWLRYKLGIGLSIYNFLSFLKSRPLSWLKKEEIQTLGFHNNQKVLGAWRYQDGLMNDTRLVIENIIAARQEGALCLNHANVVSVMQDQSGELEVGWFDILEKSSHTIRTGLVVNCAGPWVASMGRVKPGPLANSLRFSRGSHLMFDKQWDNPAILIPMKEKGRYYFVIPYLNKTLVGTTEYEVKTPTEDPIPTKQEVEEILSRLADDFPNSGLDRNSLYYCFAGIRTLFDQESSNSSLSHISRSHRWSYNQGILSLIGGKLTSAYNTVEEGFKHVSSIAGLDFTKPLLAKRKLPGQGAIGNVENFVSEAKQKNIPELIIQRLVTRYGSLVKYFLDDESMFEVINNQILKGEIEIAIDIEQAETIEDIFRRRLDLEFLPEHGLGVIESVAEILKQKRPNLNIEEEVLNYKNRVNMLRNLLELT